jgi:hypothetical protein
MATPQASTAASVRATEWPFACVATFPRMRVLAWEDDVLYASHAYTLLRGRMEGKTFAWKIAGYFRPAIWRNLTVTSRLTFRLFRDGFHALAVLRSGHMVGAVPGAIVSMAPGETEFRVSHTIARGTRPLHIASTPDGRLFWGEYFDNAARDEVHIYTSADCGFTWEVAYTFPAGSIRHVHNIVYDQWESCLWVLTGDNGDECRMLRASCDFRQVDTVMAGNQQARAVALVPTRDGIFFSSDTPLERNHVYQLSRAGELTMVANLASSSICSCRVGDAVFFSTMAEPSDQNSTATVSILGSANGKDWTWLREWEKDHWPMGLFQYGNVFLPGGTNSSGLLALTTVAVRVHDLETSIWRVNGQEPETRVL